MKYYLIAYHLPVETKSFVEFKNEMIYINKMQLSNLVYAKRFWNNLHRVRFKSKDRKAQ